MSRHHHHKDPQNVSEQTRRIEAAALPTRKENLRAPTHFLGDMDRRGALKFLGLTSAALTGALTGCARKPEREIISRAEGPEYQKPGKALYYATTSTQGPHPHGMLVQCVDGRPIKIEGNPDHPLTQGASTAAMQASILSLYDPDRLQQPLKAGAPIPWQQADKEIVEALKKAQSVVVLGRYDAGSIESELQRLFVGARGGKTSYLRYDPVETNASASGLGLSNTYSSDIYAKKILLSLDCDFMATDGDDLVNIRAFAAQRRVDDAHPEETELSRFYAAESCMTVTGGNADVRFRLKPSAMGELVQALRGSLHGEPKALSDFAAKHHLDVAKLLALAGDLADNRGDAAVVVGAHLPKSVHAAAALLNQELGVTLEGRLLNQIVPPNSPAEIRKALEAKPDVVVFLGVNPVYDFPGGGFAELLDQAGMSICHSLYPDETASRCTFALPSNHNLESWGYALTWNPYLVSIVQPVIAPLFDTRQEADSLITWIKALPNAPEEVVQAADAYAYVRTRMGFAPEGKDPEWEQCLHRGFRQSTAIQAPAPQFSASHSEELAARPLGQPGAFEVVIAPHGVIFDGRYTNNAWLQELPEGVSKTVWGNYACMSPATAKELGAEERDLVRVSVGEKTADLPVCIEPGYADSVLRLTLGYGRTQGGAAADHAGGTNVFPLVGAESAEHPRLAIAAHVERIPGTAPVVRVQKEFGMHGRPIVLDGSLSEFKHDPAFVSHKKHLPHEADMYTPYDYSKGHKWVMAIDLSKCVGCGACMTACRAENNIPVVGKEQCGKAREMHWIRIDRYVTGDPDNPTVHHQPMLCQQCDNAPCENVCPVLATAHSTEGLNEMAYNRCVGTRYCSINCPYKVRRFNYYRWQIYQLDQAKDRPNAATQELVYNPNVTVRGVGVMEKCTFCVQRLSAAKFKAQNKGKRLGGDGVKTACQQACPAGAIAFGDINDPNSQIAQWEASPRVFRTLEELHVKPNVAYMARIRNPIPGTEPAGSHDGHGANGTSHDEPAEGHHA